MNDAANAVPAGALSLSREIAKRTIEEVGKLHLDSMTLSVRAGGDSLWLFVCRDKGGGYALRTAHSAGGVRIVDQRIGPDSITVRCDSAFGIQDVRIEVIERERGVIRSTLTLTPGADMLLRHWPRDLYPIDSKGDPLGAKGKVVAAQRGLNAGLVFVERDEPGLGSLFYFQNLTALNPYFRMTGTAPDGVVGGRWPELGYQPPTAPQFGDADDKPLEGGAPVVISDALLSFSDRVVADEREAARGFLDMLGDIYPHLARPPTHYRDWSAMAAKTLGQLKRSPKLTVRHYGDLYLRPYVDAEVPDCMAQLAVARPMDVHGAHHPGARRFAGELKAGMGKFFDAKIGTIRRYLPNGVAESRKLGNEKDPNEVDSWYLYHPLTSLGQLAQMGDEAAKTLFLDSIDFAIEVARKFDYCWPVLFDVRTLELRQRGRSEGEPGQSDVGGIYAEVMLQAYDLTGEKRFLKEAEKAIRATKGMRFELEYQANLVTRGFNSSLRLWRETEDRFFLDQALVFLASFLHNCVIWESEIEAAEHYSVFLGSTALHDAPYMAIFECFESWEAICELLIRGGDDLPYPVRMICAEYCRYALSRAWYYYPSELPADIFPDEVRNGERIERNLAIPVEDLYADGKPPGQVGQEVYGCGAAFAFAAKAWRRCDQAPFILYCDYPLLRIEEEEGEIRIEAAGVAGFECRLRILPKSSRGKAVPTLSLGGVGAIALEHVDNGWEATIPAATPLVIGW